jgi:phage terminase large subunit GpA-like protein
LNDESWFIDYKTFPGSPAKPEVWKMLDDYLMQEWKHQSGITLRIVATCVDSAGHFTQNVYEYVKPRQPRRIYAVKGMAGTGRPLISRPSMGNRLRVMLFSIGVDTAKELIFARLQIAESGPGYMHFNRNCEEEYFKQLTAEKQVTRFSKGFPTKVWVKVRSRNEALDCEVYALAAFRLLNAKMQTIAQSVQRKALELKQKPQPESEGEGVQLSIQRKRNTIRKVSRSANRVDRW